MIESKFWLSLGGGVQSTAMALMIMDKTIDIPLDGIVFADTGGELPSTYDNIYRVKKIAEANNVEFKIVKRSEFFNDKFSDLRSAILSPYTKKNGEEGSSFFGIIPMKIYNGEKSVMLRHQCASNFKIRPMEKFLKIKYPKEKIIQYIGISTDEIQRMRKSPPGKFESRFPLIKFRKNRNDCLLYLQKLNWIVGKSRCYFCPHQKSHEWDEVKTNYPDLFKNAIEIDEFIRHHKYIRNNKYSNAEAYLYKRNPIASAKFIDEKEVDLFDYECGGHCAL